MKNRWYSYLIYSDESRRSYTGVTDDPAKRIKQHNGILSGGAKATRCGNDWRVIRLFRFITKKDAMSFEWYAKRKQKKDGGWVRLSGLEPRKQRFDELMDSYNAIDTSFLLKDNNENQAAPNNLCISRRFIVTGRMNGIEE